MTIELGLFDNRLNLVVDYYDTPTALRIMEARQCLTVDPCLFAMTTRPRVGTRIYALLASLWRKASFGSLNRPHRGK